MSPFHVLTAVAATLPLWVFSLREQFPWYYFISILAGELILVFFAGFLSSFLLMPFILAGTTICRKCHAAVFLAGRHFDPAGSLRPHWSDLAVFVAFIGLNVVVWMVLIRGDL